MTFLPAAREDLPAVMSILDEAACWLADRGIEQWPCPHPPHFWERVGRYIDLGGVFTVWLEGEAGPVGTLALTWSDSLWKEFPRKAAYIHKMAVGSAYHGRQFGNRMLDWAQEQAREGGAKALRLDCMAENGRLRRYYENYGFCRVAEITDRDYSACLYELGISQLHDV